MAKAVRLQLRLPPEMHERLKWWAGQQGKTLNEVVIEAIQTAGRPSKREDAALLILRQQAVRDAVALAKPGETDWDTGRRADGLLAIMLGAN